MSGLQPRLPPPPRAAGARARRSRASRRGAGSTASSMLDVLNADYVRTARAKGVPAAAGDLQARVPQRADPVRDGDRARHRVPDRRRDHHRADLLDLRAWAGVPRPRCSAGDAPFLLGWFLVGAVAVIVVQPVRRRLLRRARPADPALVSIAAEVLLAGSRSTIRASRPAPSRSSRTTGSSSAGGSSGTRWRWSSIVVLVILMIACFGAPWLAPYQQGEQDLLDERRRPEREALVRHRRPRPRPAHGDHVRGPDLADDRPGRSRCCRRSSA